MSAQDINDMNKKELRDLFVKTQLKNDSLVKLVNDVQATHNFLQSKLISLENEKAAQEKRLTALDNERKLVIEKLDINEINNKNLISENTKLKNEIEITKRRITAINDSLSFLNKNNSDFLNNYFRNTMPLNNNNFMLRLDKVMIGNDNSAAYIGENKINYLIYESGPYEKTKQFIPEVIPNYQFRMYGTKSILLKDAPSAKDALTLLDIKNIGEYLPKIEIIKNKLITLTYADGSEENFLYNIGKGNDNSYRQTLQMELATEVVESDNSENKNKDIIWKLYMLEDECYLAMNVYQLKRIKFPIHDLTQGVELREGGFFNHFRADGYNGAYDEMSSGNGFYFERVKDAFMENDQFVNPSNMVFLFKLVEK
jgi:hypothetical protein